MKKAAVAILLLVFSVAAAASPSVKIYINGNSADIPMKIQFENNRLFMSAAEVAAAMGEKAATDDKMLSIKELEKELNCNILYNKSQKTVSLSRKKLLNVRFFECGQADCSFVELPDGKCMLIDSGTADFSGRIVKFLKKSGRKKLDYVVATHPHADHIGSMSDILKKFKVGLFFMPEASHTTKTYEQMLKALKKNGCDVRYLKSGTTLFGGDVKCVAAAPVKSDYGNLNNMSAVLKLEYGTVKFLFAADAEFFAEMDILSSGVDIDADILKVAHHGGLTSSCRGFLNAVSPETAVISVSEKENPEFPARAVIRRLKRMQTDVYRTDENGDVCIIADGITYEVVGG